MSPNYPEKASITGSETVTLPSGKVVSIAKATLTFTEWRGEKIEDTYGDKALINVDKCPMFAELAILNLFKEAGWEGVWVDTFRKKYRVAWGTEGVVMIEAAREQLLKDIYRRAGTRSGCFDLYCWKEGEILFIESKRKFKDKFRSTQARWLEAALQTGLPLSAFVIVEWTF